MPPAPLTAAILSGAAATLGLVHLAVDPAPYGTGRSVLVALGMTSLTLIVVTGLLLARGRWARWASLAVAVAWMVVAARADLDILAVAVLLAAAAGVATAAGPWLPRWLRHRPSATGPPPAAVLLLLSLVANVAVLGISADDPDAVVWACAAWSALLALGVSRAASPALWAGRLLHAPIMVTCGVVIGLPQVMWIAALGVWQTGLLWRRDVHLSVSPLLPHRAPAVPIPPELIDPELLRAAGLDERGARLDGET